MNIMPESEEKKEMTLHKTWDLDGGQKIWGLMALLYICIFKSNWRGNFLLKIQPWGYVGKDERKQGGS